LITLLVEDGWFYLGPGATTNGQGGLTGAILKPSMENLLADIVSWERVWEDDSPGRLCTRVLWRGFPDDRVDFEVVGGVFTRSYDPPSAEFTKGMKAIHKDALITAKAGVEIWTDEETRSLKSGSVWNISTDGNLQGINTGAFVAMNTRYTPPTTTYAINRNKVESGHGGVGPRIRYNRWGEGGIPVGH
jgi:hypothetical protein